MSYLQKEQVNGIDVTYWRKGEGEPFVLLPGTLGDYRIFENVLPVLSSRYDTIVFHYPKIQSYHELLQKFTDLKDMIDISNPHLLGTSLGGWTAQHLVDKFDWLPSSLILTNTFCNNNILRKQNKISYQISRFLPWFIFKKIFLKTTKQPLIEYKDGLDLYQIMENIVLNLGKSDLRTRLSWSLEKIDPPEIGEELDILLLTTNDDNVLSSTVFEQLQECYPNAHANKLEGGNHFPYFLRSEKFIEIVFKFLKDQ